MRVVSERAFHPEGPEGHVEPKESRAVTKLENGKYDLHIIGGHL